jgi:hypothetical protein
LPAASTSNAREPWFYGFLETYARVSMWLRTLVCGGAELIVAVYFFSWINLRNPVEVLLLLWLVLLL